MDAIDDPGAPMVGLLDPPPPEVLGPALSSDTMVHACKLRVMLSSTSAIVGLAGGNGGAFCVLGGGRVVGAGGWGGGGACAGGGVDFVNAHSWMVCKTPSPNTLPGASVICALREVGCARCVACMTLCVCCVPSRLVGLCREIFPQHILHSPPMLIAVSPLFLLWLLCQRVG